MFLVLFWTINLREAARKIEFLDGYDILLEKRLSGVVQQGYTILYGKSRSTGGKSNGKENAFIIVGFLFSASFQREDVGKSFG
jgi:hypothetical protein